MFAKTQQHLVALLPMLLRQPFLSHKLGVLLLPFLQNSWQESLRLATAGTLFLATWAKLSIPNARQLLCLREASSLDFFICFALGKTFVKALMQLIYVALLDWLYHCNLVSKAQFVPLHFVVAKYQCFNMNFNRVLVTFSKKYVMYLLLKNSSVLFIVSYYINNYSMT